MMADNSDDRPHNCCSACDGYGAFINGDPCGSCCGTGRYPVPAAPYYVIRKNMGQRPDVIRMTDYDDNEDAMLDAIDDETRPILERAEMWLNHSDADFVRAIDLLLELTAYAKDLETKIHMILEQLDPGNPVSDADSYGLWDIWKANHDEAVEISKKEIKHE